MSAVSSTRDLWLTFAPTVEHSPWVDDRTITLVERSAATLLDALVDERRPAYRRGPADGLMIDSVS